jgi:hypothetical protein
MLIVGGLPWQGYDHESTPDEIEEETERKSELKGEGADDQAPNVDPPRAVRYCEYVFGYTTHFLIRPTIASSRQISDAS